MARRMRSHDWRSTPLGPIDHWPECLRTLVGMILAAPFPHVICWGPNLAMLYNDAYLPLLGNKPDALGRPFLEVWKEIAAPLREHVDEAIQGKSCLFKDARFLLRRDGKAEETFFDFSFTPLRDDQGTIGGIMGLAVETTRRVRTARQVRTSEARMRAVLEQMGTGVAIAALPDGELLFHNARAVELLGHPLLPSADYRGYVQYGAHHADGTPYAPEEYPMARAVLAEDAVPPEEMLYRRGDGRMTILEVGAGRVHDDTGTPILAVSTFEDITNRRLAEQRLRSLVEGIPQLVWRADATGRWTWSSPQWRDFTGLSDDESLGFGWLEAVHPEDRDTALDLWKKTGPDQRATVEYRIGPPGRDEWHWFRVQARPVLNGELISEWLGTCTDVDDLRRLQDEQSVMVAELQHRTRNLLAIVHSIAQQTVAASGSLPTFEAQFSDRLRALSRVQGLLSSPDQEPATLETLVAMELRALGADPDGDRITITGPEVKLRSRAVQTVALALHELATNARKHGALATPEGRLSVHWRIHTGVPGRWLEVDWRESGVTVPDAPAGEKRHRGYGRRLLERALPYTLGATTRFDLGPQGLHCVITLPLSLRGTTEIVG